VLSGENICQAIWVQATMLLLARRVNRVLPRLAYGAVIYWGLNAALVLAELRWHVLYRLTVWDASQLQTIVPVLGKLFHQ
jgi:hypothetical protein